jgi:dipeptidase
VDGRYQFSRDCAWWAFVRVAKMAARIWGHMRKDVAEVRDALQKEALDNQSKIEAQASELYQKDPQEAIVFLTEYTNQFCQKMVEAYWKLGDILWVKYQDKM